MKKAIKYAAIAGGLYVLYMLMTQKKGVVTVGPLQQYPAAWDTYWNTQNQDLTDAQKQSIQNEIAKGNIKFT